jgi:filamentous hemagglutinin
MENRINYMPLHRTALAVVYPLCRSANHLEVVLGKYIPGSSASYAAVAQARRSTYFSMSDWAQVKGQLGEDQMWNINKAFMDQQMAQGKKFLFTSDPSLAPSNSYTALERRHLLDSGYSFQATPGGFYRAVKK